jgi:hypothetical protein
MAKPHGLKECFHFEVLQGKLFCDKGLDIHCCCSGLKDKNNWGGDLD